MAKSPIAAPVLSNIPVLGVINEVTRALNGIRALVAYLEARGIPRERLTQALELAEREGRDLTETEVASLVGEAQEAIDRLREASSGAQDDTPAPPANEGDTTETEHPSGG